MNNNSQDLGTGRKRKVKILRIMFGLMLIIVFLILLIYIVKTIRYIDEKQELEMTCLKEKANSYCKSISLELIDVASGKHLFVCAKSKRQTWSQGEQYKFLKEEKEECLQYTRESLQNKGVTE